MTGEIPCPGCDETLTYMTEGRFRSPSTVDMQVAFTPESKAHIEAHEAQITSPLWPAIRPWGTTPKGGADA